MRLLILVRRVLRRSIRPRWSTAHLEELADNWRTSIVDLLNQLDIDSSPAARKELADELAPVELKNGSAELNTWLHRTVLRKIAENGGNVPRELTEYGEFPASRKWCWAAGRPQKRPTLVRSLGHGERRGLQIKLGSEDIGVMRWRSPQMETT